MDERPDRQRHATDRRGSGAAARRDRDGRPAARRRRRHPGRVRRADRRSRTGPRRRLVPGGGGASRERLPELCGRPPRADRACSASRTTSPPSTRETSPPNPLSDTERGSRSPVAAWGSGETGRGTSDDSGIYAADLPDVRAAEAEAARRQRLRRLRDWLLVAAAVAILLIGLSLVGLAYLASGQPGARIDLTPVPVMAPAAPAVCRPSCAERDDLPGLPPDQGEPRRA